MRFFLLAMLSFLFVQPILAQNALSTAPQAEEQIQEMLGKKAPKKELNSVEEYAHIHKQNCLNTQSSIFDEKHLKLLCSCTASKVADVMNLDQIRDMQKNTQEGLFQRHRMLLFAYAPCIEKPLHKAIMRDCMSSTRNKHLMKNQGSTCACLSSRVGADMQKLAPQYIEGAIRRNEDIPNPLEFLVNSDHLNRKMSWHTRMCLREYEGIY